jgi:hypothetical protein
LGIVGVGSAAFYPVGAGKAARSRSRSSACRASSAQGAWLDRRRAVRNWHRSRLAWSKPAIRTILSNPRHTGRQVWNKQRKDEVLIDVEDVALDHQTQLRWNDREKWIWSEQIVHDPLIDADTFGRAQVLLAARGAGRTTRERVRVDHPYLLRSRLYCGVCDRRMQAQRSHGSIYYRCRFPQEYALTNRVKHPRNV